MKRICPDCQYEMEMDCSFTSPYGIYLKKKRRGFFKSTVEDKIKAAVCTNCGHVTLYIDNYETFKD